MNQQASQSNLEQRGGFDAYQQVRRESYELGRKYLIEQTRLQNKSRCEEIEFLDFLKSDQYWPLHCDVYSLGSYPL